MASKTILSKKKGFSAVPISEDEEDLTLTIDDSEGLGRLNSNANDDNEYDTIVQGEGRDATTNNSQDTQQQRHNQHQKQSNIPSLVVAFLASLTTGGTTYAFGLYGAALKSSLHLSQSQLDTISTANFCAGLFSWIPGLIVDTFGTRFAISLGGIWGALNLITYWAVATKRFIIIESQAAIVVTLCILGVSIFLSAALVTGSVFKIIVGTCGPGTKGSAVGVAKGYVGLGAGAYACLFQSIRTKQESDLDFLPMAAFFCIFIVTIPALCLLPNNADFKSKKIHDESTPLHFRTLFCSLLCMAIFIIGSSMLELMAEHHSSSSPSSSLSLDNDSSTAGHNHNHKSQNRNVNDQTRNLYSYESNHYHHQLEQVVVDPSTRIHPKDIGDDDDDAQSYVQFYKAGFLLAIWIVPIFSLLLLPRRKFAPPVLVGTGSDILDDAEEDHHHDHVLHPNDNFDDEGGAHDNINNAELELSIEHLLLESSDHSEPSTSSSGAVARISSRRTGASTGVESKKKLSKTKKDSKDILTTSGDDDKEKLSLLESNSMHLDTTTNSSTGIPGSNGGLAISPSSSSLRQPAATTVLSSENTIATGGAAAASRNNSIGSAVSTGGGSSQNNGSAGPVNGNYTLFQMLQTPSAMLMLWTCTILAGAGTVETNNMGQMVESLGLPHVTTSVSLSFFSVAQAAARVATGAISESALNWRCCTAQHQRNQQHHQNFITRKCCWCASCCFTGGTGIPRPFFLVAASVAGFIAHGMLAFAVDKFSFVIGSALAGGAFGMIWPLMVLITGEVFGTANVGANYMFYDGFVSAIGTLLLSKMIAQQVYEDHINVVHHTHAMATDNNNVTAATISVAGNVGGEGPINMDVSDAGSGTDTHDHFTCLGTGCFQLTHITIAILSLTCVITSFRMMYTTRHIYDKPSRHAQ